MDDRQRSPGPAIPLLLILLPIWIAALGGIDAQPARGADAEVARVTSRIDSLVRDGSYEPAYLVADSLLRSLEEQTGVDSLTIADVLDVRADAQLWLSGAESDDLVRSVRRAVRIRESDSPEPGTPLANSLRRLGTALRQREQYDEAGEALFRARDIARMAAPVDSIALAYCYSELGTLHTETGDYVAALEFFDEDLSISTRVLAPDDPELARKLSNLSRVHLRLSEFEKAIELNLRGQEITRAIDPRHPWLAYFENTLGSIRADMGQMQQAYEAYQEALRRTRESVGEESLLGVSIHNNLGVHYLDLRDFDRAAEELEIALRIARSIAEEQSVSIATPLGNLASVHRDRGDYAEAERLYVESIGMLEERLGPDHQFLAQRLEDLGWVHIEAGAPGAAEGDFARSRDIRMAALPAGNFDTGRAIHGHARALHGLGRLDEALEEFVEASRIIEGSVGAGHPYLVRPLFDQAVLLADLGRFDEAAILARRSESSSRDYVLLTARFLPEGQALDFAQGRLRGVDLLASLAAEGVEARAALDELVRSRAMILDEMAGRRAALVSRQDESAVRAAREFAVRSREYADLLVRGPGEDAAPVYQQKLVSARRALDTAEIELAALSDRFRGEQARRRAGLDEVIGALPEGSGLVACIRYQGRPAFDEGGSPPRRSDWPERYGAFVVFDGAVRFVELGDATSLDAAIGEWRDEVMAPAARGRGHGAAPDGMGSYVASARRLRARLFDPVREACSGARQLFIVPDGELNVVNWSALVEEDGRFLLESVGPIHYLSSESDLIVTPAAGNGLLAVGNIAYDRSAPAADSTRVVVARDDDGRIDFRGDGPGCPAFEDVRFSALPGTGREVRTIRTLFEDGSGPGEPSLVLEGTDATESRVFEEAAGRSVVHLATHGFVLGLDCFSGETSRGITELADLDPAPAADDLNTTMRLQLSGLALAGANLRDRSAIGEEDGILTAQEVAALDLSDTQWVVLSACNTARGAIRVGEGVFGLRRAFRVAGARTLIMSLWPVDDRSTESWMAALYRARFTEGSSTSEAVHQASLEVLRERQASGKSPHPFFWGGFVAAGSWQ